MNELGVRILEFSAECLITIVALSVGWVAGVVRLCLGALGARQRVWEPKHVLITGASSGLGEELAKRYARESGARLELLGRDLERLNAVAKACRELGAEAEVHQANVAEEEKMAELLVAIDARQPLDLVVANAGVTVATVKPGDSQSIEDWSVGVRSLDKINWQGTLNTVLPLVERFRARQSGQFAIMSSIASIVLVPSSTSYSISKVAQRYFGEGLRDYLAPHGVGVSTIAPGFVATPLTQRNRFRMPDMISSEEAIHIIYSGLRSNQGLILTHRLAYWMLRALSALPYPLQSWLLSKYSPSSKSTRLYKRD